MQQVSRLVTIRFTQCIKKNCELATVLDVVH